MTPWVMPLHELVHEIACWESTYLHAEGKQKIENSSKNDISMRVHDTDFHAIT